MTDRLFVFYREGHAARLDGKACFENPYPVLTPAYNAWDMGWRREVLHLNSHQVTVLHWGIAEMGAVKKKWPRKKTPEREILSRTKS